MFLDESGILMAPLVRRSWAPAGQTPVLYQRGAHHRKVSVIAALCVSPQRDQLRFYFRLHPDTDISAAEVMAFLRALDDELRDRWLLLWDRLNAHRARRTQDFLQAHGWPAACFFPSYAPELNPVEYAWCWLKHNPLANLVRLDPDSLAAITRQHARALQRKPLLLRSFLRHSPLFLRLR
ncbi:MAG TPA: transposase [Terriglobales bacterium]|nr:transposase [Terriglobales bacterium]